MRDNSFLARSDSALHFSAAEASCADVNVTGRAVHNSLDTLDIGLPGSVRSPVRVADLNAERHVLAAKFTLCHFTHLLLKSTI